MNYLELVRTLKKLGVKDITQHHSGVDANTAYIALTGKSFSANNFIEEALSNKAPAIILDSQEYLSIKNDKQIFRCDNLKDNLSMLVKLFYEVDLSFLSIIGVTGTNGKTSCAHFIAQTLQNFGCNSEIIGTLGYGAPNSLDKQPMTTPDVVSLYKILSNQISKKVTHVAMEVSSHALVQKRIQGLNFACVIFTNLSAEHLDYHGSMENYYQAKKKLFIDYDATNRIINLDCDYGQRLAKEMLALNKKVIGFCINKDKIIHHKNMSIVVVDEISQFSESISLAISINDNSYKFKTNLLGLHNVSNILALISTLYSLEFDASSIISKIELLHPVPGRMVQIFYPNKPKVIVDYAHSPDGLEKIIQALKYHANKIICVFGCGGDRDKEKRAKMAKIAESNSSFCIVTNDNPRFESPENIVKDIVAGFKQNNYKVIYDRKEAIKYALEISDVNTIILVAGKGHEEHIIINNKLIPHNDIEEVRKLLE